ncbi:amidase family protein [uncultured Microbacterium sp.]|uniref:amidase family protein n=1 Tax=uncultured Microbacterium sp. TaxID=191216 RepID=UPI0035CA17F3
MSPASPLDLAAWRIRLDHGEPTHPKRASIEQANSSLQSHRAFISVAPGTREEAASGPLAGIPFAVKDNIYTVDLPTTGGCRALASWHANIDAPVVAALREAGAWVVGKTNLHELALGVTSNNAAYGAVRNPIDSTRSAGGSSGGSAVAVALGVVPFALGTDTGGSMTIPAAACGVVGYRPSARRYSPDGVIHISQTRDEIGVFANTVHDVQVIDGILRRESVPTNPAGVTRLGVPDRYFYDLDDQTELAVARALETLRSQDVELHPVSIDDVVDGAHEHGFSIVGVEALADLDAFLGSAGSGLGLDLDTLVSRILSPDVRLLLTALLENPISEQTYRRALAERARLRARMSELFVRERLDALVYPTTPVLPPLLGEDVVRSPRGDLAVFPTLTRHTEAGSVIGAPSISIPVAAPGEPAVGLTLEGAPDADIALLHLAAEVSHLLEPSRRPSPLSSERVRP